MFLEDCGVETEFVKRKQRNYLSRSGKPLSGSAIAGTKSNANYGDHAARRMAQDKQILKTLFDLELSEAGVHVVFRPTNSHYFFRRLHDDASRLLPERALATFPMVDPDGYDQHEVYRMALSLASAAANRAWNAKKSAQ
jgi:hypothetical protein